MKIIITGNRPPLTEFETDDLPDFVILTGINGVGKSILLERIVEQLPYSAARMIAIRNVQLLGFERIFNPIYLKTDWPSLSKSTLMMLTHLTDLKADYSIYTNAYDPRTNRSVAEMKKYQKLNHRLKTKEIDYSAGISFEVFEENYCPLEIQHSPDLNTINQYFLKYKADYLARTNAKGWSHEKFIDLYGEEPWIILNKLLSDANIPYKFNAPNAIDYTSNFTLLLISNIDKSEIDPALLSSGEKVILNLLLYVFIGLLEAEMPTYFLLDEPDAHLHPQLTKSFIDTIDNILVKKYGSKVIMTTHSPSTIAFAPEGSVYEMHKNPTSIIPSLSKSASISLLTAGYLFVGENTKYVLVEADNDVKFYSIIYGHLNKANRIDRDKQIVFISAASNREKSGGKSVVISWVDKLVNSGLDKFIHGLIDKDIDNEVQGNIHRLERYSIENYLIDPILVYAVLLDQDKAPLIPGINLNYGEEFKLREMSSAELQVVADYIFRLVEPALIAYSNKEQLTIDRSVRLIEFINGQQLNYPAWLIGCRGKDLLSEVFIETFGGAIYNLNKALKVLQKMHTVTAVDFEILFSEIQNQ